jgi:hypothetical protein
MVPPKEHATDVKFLGIHLGYRVVTLLDADTVKGNVTIGPPSLRDHPDQVKSALVFSPLPLSPKSPMTTAPIKVTDRSLELFLKAFVAERFAATLDSKTTVSTSMTEKAFSEMLLTVPGMEIAPAQSRVTRVNAPD